MEPLSPLPDTQPQRTEPAVSVCPAGKQYRLPQPEDYASERRRLHALVAEQRGLGREVVVVMGVGFVGAIMAAVVADSVDKTTGAPGKFVLAMQRPSARSYWKIPYLQRGLPPVQSEDPEVAEIIHRCVLEKQTLSATFSYDALELADVVVVDVQCDYVKDKLGDMRVGRADLAALEESFQIIGERIQPACLVLIETTVPPGTTERIAYPILARCFEARGLTQTFNVERSTCNVQRVTLNFQRRTPRSKSRIPAISQSRNRAAARCPSRCSPTPTSASCPAATTWPPSGTSGGSAAA